MDLPFREVYKCSWLKLPPAEKKSGFLPKLWVIFCVHNDTLPFLEVYADEKMALTHKPSHSYQLSNVLHITPSICPQDDDEYEFVITFPTEMVRFTASSQHQMMSWVKRLNAKLREMKLLAPNENLYTSHSSENKSHLLPTRDPNSPLPLPPAIPYIPPGVEPVSSSSAENSEHANRTLSDNVLDDQVLEMDSTSNVTPPTRTVRVNQEVIDNIESPVAQISDSPISNTLSTSQNRLNDSNDSTNERRPTSSNNVTVIEVSSSSLLSNDDVFTFTNVNSELYHVDRGEIQEMSTVSVMPINSDFENVSITRRTLPVNSDERSNQANALRNESDFRATANDRPVSNTSESSPQLNVNVYEHVFLPTVPPLAGCSQQLSNPCVSSPLSPVPPESKLSPLTSVSLQPSNSSQQLPKMGRGRGNARGRRRSNSNSESNSNHQVAADRIRAAGPPSNSSQRLQPAPHPFVRQVNSEESASSRLTLREQQVMQLRREMSHPGGVRLQLRRKDCLNSIAFIDAFQAVWIAGWKQKEHPMLYTALHIGDQLISLGGKIVNNAADAQKLIRAWPSLYIEFVIRRVPCGRVYALRKEQEGQNLGIIQDNNTGEIKEVVVKSIVAANGLTSRVRTMNGLSWTTWYITEINGRPLNLFFKDNEIRDRLNAVGLDISLLVQPSDLIKQIKKQLKLVKNYKDYIVQ